jgi:lysosomal Pro-X carboxypeptidase
LSNVVWSNGALDPWSRLGVTEDSDFLDVLDDSKGLEAVFLENGAHHLDFFWSRDDDAEDVRSARARETELVRRWIEEKHERFFLTRDGRDGAGKKHGFVSRTTA